MLRNAGVAAFIVSEFLKQDQQEGGGKITHTHTHTHARMHAHTHTHTQNRVNF